MKRINFNSIKSKLIISMILVFLIPITLISIIIDTQVKKQLKNDVINSTTNEIQQVDKTINTFFDGIKENVHMMALNPVIMKIDGTVKDYLDNTSDETMMTPSKNGGIESQIYHEFERFAKTHPQYTYVYLGTEKGGYIQWPESTIMKNFDPRPSQFYTTAMGNKGNITISKPYYWAADKTFGISIVSTFKDENGDLAGVMGMDVGLNGMTDMIKEMKIGKNGYVILTDSKGTIIAHPHNSDMNFKNISELKIKGIEDISKLTTGNFETTIDKKQNIINVYSSKKTGWNYIAIIEKSDIMAGATKIETFIIILAIVFLAIAVLISLILGKKFSDPIKECVDIMKSIQAGIFNKDVPKKLINRKDEIGVLSNALSEIVESLKEKAHAAQKIAEGNLNVKIRMNSDNDSLSKSMILLVDTIKNLASETKFLTNSYVDGKLDIRGDSHKFNGEYKEIVDGINQTLDAVIQPVKEATNVLSEMSMGNLNIYVEGQYKGDHAVIKDALNSTIKNLSGYIEEISCVLGEMNKGNFDTNITGDYKGDFAKIKNSINSVIKSINEILININNVSQQVASGASQVSDSAQTLSQATTEQASIIEELTSSMQQISEQTKQNAIGANNANSLAITAKDSAEHGNKQMKEMLVAMTEINNASGDISKIIKVIDEIAFQTNILALNAAVEAARAGQHGKGFAVVAQEVRNLAARSADAAKETTSLIESSIKKTEDGMKLTVDTANALNTIVDGVTKAAELVGNIAVSSNEQATAIANINIAVEQVSSTVQNNSATSQESAAASEELSGQAEILKELVGKYNIKVLDNYEVNTNDFYYEGIKDTKKISQTKNQNKKLATLNSKFALSTIDLGKY